MKRFNFVRNLFVVLALSFAGCSNQLSMPELQPVKVNEISEASEISDISNVSFVLTAGLGSAKTALPVYSWGNYFYDLYYIPAYDSSKTEEDYKLAVEKKAFSNFENGSLPLPKGNYKFKLTGYDSNANDSNKIIVGETVINLTEDSQTIPFKMYPVAEGNGSVFLNLIFPDDGVITKVKADLSSIRGTAPETEITIQNEDGKKSAKVIFTENVPAGKTNYININCFDANGKLVFDFAESAYVVRGLTSASTIELKAEDYYRKAVSITIKKDGEAWTDAPTTIVLKDKTDPTKEYILTGTNGEYTGFMPEDDNTNYEIFIKGTGTSDDIDTGSKFNPSTESILNSSGEEIASVEVVTITLPTYPGLNFTPSSSTNSGIISSGNDSVIVPKGQDFLLDVSIADGYNKPESGKITIDGEEYIFPAGDDNRTIIGVEFNAGNGGALNPVINKDSTGQEIPDNSLNAIEYTLTFVFATVDGFNDSSNVNSDLNHLPTTYTVERDVELPNDYDHISCSEEGNSAVGWKITEINGIAQESTVALTKIKAGTQTGNLTLVPFEVVTGNVKYTTEIWVENINDDNYTMVWSFVEYAIPGTEITSKVHSGWEDYIATTDTQVIKSDGSTVLKTKFKRKHYSFTANPGAGTWADGTTGNKEIEGKFEAAVSIPEITPPENYVFTGWENDLPQTFKSNINENTYTAQYSQEYAKYTVKYLFEKVDSTDASLDANYEELTAYPAQEKKAKIGTSVTATADLVTGFNEPAIIGTTVTADGDAEVIVKYSRKLITLTLDLMNGKLNGDKLNGETNPAPIVGKYGTRTPEAPAPVREGYEFMGWNKVGGTLPTVFPAENSIYQAVWQQTGAKYLVKVFVEDVYGNNQLVSSKEQTGIIGQEPADDDILPAEKPDGVDAGFVQTPTIVKTVVSADTMVVQEVRYTRKEITYTFKLDGGKVNGSTEDVIVKGKYGTAVTSPVPSYKYENGVDQFVFQGWGFQGLSTTVPATFGSSDRSFEAIWYTQVSGNGQNPMLQDIALEVNVSGKTITVTATPPYSASWIYIWYVNGVQNSETGTTLTLTNPPNKKYTIEVEATEKTGPSSITLNQQIEFEVNVK
ncbi:MAG: hypothetical protein MJ185_04185 [Treponema sp.]|nr:hypothetical protein [Treponema sp.]